jgi:hypothetical protein
MWNKLSSAYSNHVPAHVKQAAGLDQQHAFLNPTGNALADYGIYGGGGALGGAAIGALINMLRDEDALTGALVGGGAGLGLGLGGKALLDANMRPRYEALQGVMKERDAALARYNTRGANMVEGGKNPQTSQYTLNPDEGYGLSLNLPADPAVQALLQEAQNRDYDAVAKAKAKYEAANKGMSLGELFGI